MPELPDVMAYIHALEQRVIGRKLQKLQIVSPFVLRTYETPVSDTKGKTVEELQRIGKRIVFKLNTNLFMAVHLMIAGRFRWVDQSDAKPPGKIGLASFHFDHGTLHLVESSKKKRASIHIMRGSVALDAFDRGGIDVLTCSPEQFREQLQRENHTLKRALTDPRLFDGIGNAYSDEILHAAGLSPLKWTTRLTDEEITRLHDACRRVLQHWIDALRKKFDIKFPGPRDITAFRPEFAAHGKFGEPCPTCGAAIQRIVYSENEVNYCPRCQTDGKILADRSLSRLLHNDWPRTIEELED